MRAPEARPSSGPIVVEERFCGIAGRGQGGYLAGLVAGSSEQPIQVDFRNPIPLDRPMEIAHRGERLQLVDGEKVIVERRSGAFPSRIPPAVDGETARRARREGEANMPDFIGSCFSCGTRSDTLRVHAGPVGDGRFATPYRPPHWTAREAGVAPPFVWAPLDCASGWALSWHPPHAVAVTASLTLQIHRPIEPGVEYVIVADTEPEWRARRRNAWAAMFTTDGSLVANAESLWIRLADR